MKPSIQELIFVLIIGGLQPIFEFTWGTQTATYYNIAAVVIVLLYVIIRIARSGKKLVKVWGIRTDNFKESIIPYLITTILGSAFVYAYGSYLGNTPLPHGFWYVLALYPVWGFAQQFVLQNFVAKNLTELVPSLPLRSLITALIFACAHIPSLQLFVLTLGIGFVFTYLYHRYQNLFALSIAHGILGALVFHLVLGQNQWEILQKYFT